VFRQVLDSVYAVKSGKTAGTGKTAKSENQEKKR
jgi:hypothetical protein